MLLAGENNRDRALRKRAGSTERLCAATGEVKPVDDMIRFVIGPDHTVVPDLKCKLPGRGVWVTGTRQALKLAIDRRSFERSFKREVCVPVDLAEWTEGLLQRGALDALAMCHKAGKAVIGFTRVEAGLGRGALAAVLRAMPASAERVRKLHAALAPEGARPVVFNRFTSAQLDLAFGRPNVIHAGLLAGSETGTFLTRVARLDRFRRTAMAGSVAIAKYGLLAPANERGRRSRGDFCGMPTMVELDR